MTSEMPNAMHILHIDFGQPISGRAYCARETEISPFGKIFNTVTSDKTGMQFRVDESVQWGQVIQLGQAFHPMFLPLYKQLAAIHHWQQANCFCV